MTRPLDTVDIPDESEPEHNIPDAVCDLQTPLGDELAQRVGRWLTERSRMSHLESIGQARSSDWQGCDDDAIEIAEAVAARFEIFPIVDPGTVVASQGDVPHVGVVIRPFGPWRIFPGYALVHWTHVGICDEWTADLTILGDELDPPDPDMALTFDECEAAGVDGTLRFIDLCPQCREDGHDTCSLTYGCPCCNNTMAAMAEGPTCSICDGLGHGYPGGGPCPLEERGYDDARQDEERFG